MGGIGKKIIDDIIRDKDYVKGSTVINLIPNDYVKKYGIDKNALYRFTAYRSDLPYEIQKSLIENLKLNNAMSYDNGREKFLWLAVSDEELPEKPELKSTIKVKKGRGRPKLNNDEGENKMAKATKTKTTGKEKAPVGDNLKTRILSAMKRKKQWTKQDLAKATNAKESSVVVTIHYLAQENKVVSAPGKKTTEGKGRPPAVYSLA